MVLVPWLPPLILHLVDTIPRHSRPPRWLKMPLVLVLVVSLLQPTPISVSRSRCPQIWSAMAKSVVLRTFALFAFATKVSLVPLVVQPPLLRARLPESVPLLIASRSDLNFNFRRVNILPQICAGALLPWRKLLGEYQKKYYNMYG